jgi:hypothetical protein
MESWVRFLLPPSSAIGQSSPTEAERLFAFVCRSRTRTSQPSFGPTTQDKRAAIASSQSLWEMSRLPYVTLPSTMEARAALRVRLNHLNPLLLSPTVSLPRVLIPLQGKLPFTIGKTIDDYPGGRDGVVSADVAQPNSTFDEGVFIDYKVGLSPVLSRPTNECLADVTSLPLLVV